MAKELNLKVRKDHLETITNVSGTTALMELIWNSLDADSTELKINQIENSISTDSIEFIDNGHGIDYERALHAFENLGGSQKKDKKFSPNNRALHGEEGKGRYSSFGLGDLITFNSVYYDKKAKAKKTFNIVLDKNNLTKPSISDLENANENSEIGVKIIIKNVNEKKASNAFSDSSIENIEQKLALYYQQYPNFSITINNKLLDFTSNILHEFSQDIIVDERGTIYNFKIRIIEWSKQNAKKIFFCNENAISFGDTSLGVQTSGVNLSAYLTSEYIGILHKQNLLNVGELDYVISDALNKSKKIIKSYVLQKLHLKSIDFINDLKEKQIYPYELEPIDDVEKATRQVFDIVALNINEFVPNFSEQQDVSKKLTLTLVREALENDSSSLGKIITEIIKLPQDKINDLNELLETTSLSTIIDTMKEVSDRLRLLYEIKLIVMDTVLNKKVLERKHLHKIIEKETWIFGDEFVLGASDVNLKNVLKSHLAAIGRDDFESVVDNGGNQELHDIPDICLWKQYNNGKNGYFRNLVIELKRPSVNAGTDELNQIMNYANKVSADLRFEKDKTEWTFILLVNDIKEDINLQCNQTGRKFGHIHTSNNLNVFIVKWGTLLNEAESRHQYLKEKLNYNITENQEGLSMLNKRYKEYLPNELII
jgi:hypothetical protein